MNDLFDPAVFVHLPGVGHFARASFRPCGSCGGTRWYAVKGAARCHACVPPKKSEEVLGWLDLESRRFRAARPAASGPEA